MKRKSPVKHKVTRKTKSGKTVTYYAGKGAKSPDKKGSGNEFENVKKRSPAHQENIDSIMEEYMNIFDKNTDDLADMDNHLIALEQAKSKIQKIRNEWKEKIGGKK